MPNFKISELTPCGPISGNELVPILQKDINNKNTPTTFSAKLSQLTSFVKDYIIPPGTVWIYAAPIDKKDILPPPGWLLCDGALHPVVTYPRLYKVLGDLYGATATPGTTFKVPNIQGRFIIGFSSYNRAIVPNFGSFLGQGITMGKKGGEYNTILSEETMPRHTHILENRTPPRYHLCYPHYTRITSDAGVTGGVIKQQQGESIGFFESGKDGRPDGPRSNPDYIELGGISTKESGQTQPHPNTPPYICLNHIIKY